MPRRIGRFEVLTRLGVGGSASVYLARTEGQHGFERTFALKVLHPHLLAERAFVAMFLDEARVAARIHHPNVVPILDLCDEDGHVFIVMEYVQGDTLWEAQRTAQRLQRALPLPLVLRACVDALRGLDAAHNVVDSSGRPMGLVHRDATPHNIILGVDGVARVTDFGIARAEGRLAHTDLGTVKGKIGYMAPEQLAGRPIDRRADVFAMGVTLWEAIALRRCFPIDLSRVSALPRYRPVRQFVPDAPTALDPVIAAAVAPAAADRFPSAGAFADALERAAGSLVPHRLVGTFVRAFAADKIGREHAALHAAQRGSGPPPAPSFAPHALLSEDELEQPTRVQPPRRSHPEVVPIAPHRGRTLIEHAFDPAPLEDLEHDPEPPRAPSAPEPAEPAEPPSPDAPPEISGDDLTTPSAPPATIEPATIEPATIEPATIEPATIEPAAPIPEVIPRAASNAPARAPVSAPAAPPIGRGASITVFALAAAALALALWAFAHP